MTALLLTLCIASGDDLGRMVRIEPTTEPPPTGTEPLLTMERGPFSAAVGGYLRVGDEGDGLDAFPLIYTRGEILPLLGIRYDLEAFLPGARSGELSLRAASISMQLASTPALGGIHLGILPVPFGLDSERLRPDQPLLRPSPVEETLGFASNPGFVYRLDHRASLVPLLAEVGVFDLADGDGGLRRALIHAHIEASPWGVPDTARSLRIGSALGLVGDGVTRRMRVLGYGHFRWLRLRVEGELCHAQLEEDRLTARAWHALVGFDLLAEFLELLAVIGETRGVASIEGARSGAFVSAGVRLFVVRRRLVIAFQWRGDAFGRDLDLDVNTWMTAFDVRF